MSFPDFPANLRGGGHACAVCRWPLRESTDGVTTWFKHRHDITDHEPVPVATESLEVSLRCDFCDIESVVDVVLSESFYVQIAGREDSFSAGNWAACADCGALIRREAWSALITRVKAARPDLRMTRSFLTFLYGRLQHHMVGVTSLDEWRRSGPRYPRE